LTFLGVFNEHVGMRRMTIVGLVPPLAVNLAFETAEVVTREMLFLDGATTTSEGLFEQGKEFKIGRTLRVDSRSQ